MTELEIQGWLHQSLRVVVKGKKWVWAGTYLTALEITYTTKEQEQSRDSIQPFLIHFPR